MKPLSNLPAAVPQAVLGALLGQQTRQITLETALASDNLVVERFTATEAVSASFVLHIDCLSPSAHLDTAKLASQEVTLRLMQGDGKRRAWHGYVADCASLGGDGGLARYRLRVCLGLTACAHAATASSTRTRPRSRLSKTSSANTPPRITRLRPRSRAPNDRSAANTAKPTMRS